MYNRSNAYPMLGFDSVNFEDEESLNWFHRTLRDRGIIQALRDKGAGEGSTICIGDMEFDFIE